MTKIADIDLTDTDIIIIKQALRHRYADLLTQSVDPLNANRGNFGGKLASLKILNDKLGVK